MGRVPYPLWSVRVGELACFHCQAQASPLRRPPGVGAVADVLGGVLSPLKAIRGIHTGRKSDRHSGPSVIRGGGCHGSGEILVGLVDGKPRSFRATSGGARDERICGMRRHAGVRNCLESRTAGRAAQHRGDRHRRLRLGRPWLLRQLLLSHAERRSPGHRGHAVHRGLCRLPGLLADAGRLDDRQVPGPAAPDRLAPRRATIRRSTNCCGPSFASSCRWRKSPWPRCCNDAGYATATIGKWHLGGKGFEPTRQGFDIGPGGVDVGSATSHFAPFLDAPASRCPGSRSAPGRVPDRPADERRR